MLSIDFSDFLAVLNLAVPYLVALGIVIVVSVAAMVFSRKKDKAMKHLIRSQALVAMLLALVIVANLIAFGPMATLIGLATGSGTISDETTDVATVVAQEVADEGFVLLENEGLLPLAGTSNLNLFGWASANPLYGGAGSGGINDLYPIVSLKQGLENSGFKVNQDLFDFYKAYTSERPEMSIQKQSWTLPEPPASTYSQELLQGAKDFSDVAVIVISRMAGEGHSDMPKDVSTVAFDQNSPDYVDFAPGEHYLQLSQTEEDMVQLVCDNFDKVVVVYNGANPIQLGFVEDYSQIKAAIWAPGPGNVGFNSLGKILSGEVNPSGKSTDTFVYDVTAAPWWSNWVKSDYSNLSDMAVEGMNAGRPTIYTPSFINYVEGIYVGYKFYETAAAEGLIDYDTTVQYPFGHGLSYTTFSQQMGAISESNGTLSFDVTVTNTGAVAGRDVVEVYFNPPYTNGGIEKATANLVAFDKTDLLEPGASQTLTITLDVEDMASFDSKTEQAYVLDAGDYILSINRNSNEILAQQTYTVPAKVVYTGDNKRPSDQTAATSLFDYVAGDVTYLSRQDGFANYAVATAAPASLEMTEDYVKGYFLNSNFDYASYLNPSDVMPTTGANTGLKLADLRGADYEDARWDKLLDQMTVPEMVHLTSLAGYQTPAVQSIGKVGTVDADGPAAINNNFTRAGSIGFPVAVVIANTWNQDLAERYGEAMGQMNRELNGTGWYAPAMNTHRVPFGGRNYEYYSEDGVLAGRIGSSAVKGAEKHGVYSFIKHFALYDSNTKMVSIWSNEQAMREIYLKPFELSIKEGGADAVMVSWNFLANKWTGSDSNLMNTVLRGEWGLKGMALTDFFRNNGHGFMNADMALANGVDAMLSTYDAGPNVPKDPNAPTTVLQMRTASKNILYTVVNSWAYEDTVRSQLLLPWQIAAIVINIVILALVVLLEILIIRGYQKRKRLTA